MKNQDLLEGNVSLRAKKAMPISANKPATGQDRSRVYI
jgi:hypothetical protein